jgi:superfamily I DNA and/or RNA helicase
MPNARIGTVDRFQGREAPIVIYCMTTSTHADAPVLLHLGNLELKGRAGTPKTDMPSIINA